MHVGRSGLKTHAHALNSPPQCEELGLKQHVYLDSFPLCVCVCVQALAVMLLAHRAVFPPPCFCSTILAEEKAQQEERSRMEMRRQVNVSWDSGGSDEAPPKVSSHIV